jgi:hypothetical protein
LIKDPFLRLASDRVLGHKQYREGGARGSEGGAELGAPIDGVHPFRLMTSTRTD